MALLSGLNSSYVTLLALLSPCVESVDASFFVVDSRNRKRRKDLSWALVRFTRIRRSSRFSH